jgi:hypothetical protein
MVGDLSWIGNRVWRIYRRNKPDGKLDGKLDEMVWGQLGFIIAIESLRLEVGPDTGQSQN